MSMNQILSPEDHTGFYSALGFSIALVLIPWFQNLFTIPIDETEGFLVILTIDTMLTLTTIGGLITGFLYILQPDKLGDIILKNRLGDDT